MPVELTRRLFDVDEYHRMAQAGILSERDRVELVEGEIVAKPPIGSRHNAAVNRATRALVTSVGDQAIVQVQGSVRLNSQTEPEPDLALPLTIESASANAAIHWRRWRCRSAPSPSTPSSLTDATAAVCRPKSVFQNQRRPLVAQAFRPAKRPPGSPEGLRYRNSETRSNLDPTACATRTRR